MAWYDVFSRFYDASLEPHYRVQREEAVRALDVRPGQVVLDLPCGTGQTFPALVTAVGEQGAVVGIDLSPGMLREAERRKATAGWTNVYTGARDAASLTIDDLAAVVGRRVEIDRLLVFLGMSVFPEPERTFDRLWSLLVPGGRCVLVDVHTERLGLQGRMVNWVARADITREFWRPLEAVGVEFERRALPSKPLHGGTIFLATARKP